MPKLPKNNGLRLFNKCAKQVKKEFEKQGRPEKWNEIQKWTSANVYPKFKGKSVNQVKVSEIKKELDLALGLTKPKKVSPCFSVFAVNRGDLEEVEWWDMENTLQGLPTNVQVRINGTAEFGRTRIDQAGSINPEIEVQPIVEKIREYTSNKSGLNFNAVIKVVPNKKDDGSNCSYFIDFVLAKGEENLESEGQVVEEREVSQIDTGRVERLKGIKSKKKKTKREKLKETKSKTRPKKTKAKKPVVKKAKKQVVKKATKTKEPRPDIVRALELLKEDYKDGIYTKEEYKKERKILISKFEKGGLI